MMKKNDVEPKPEKDDEPQEARNDQAGNEMPAMKTPRRGRPRREKKAKADIDLSEVKIPFASILVDISRGIANRKGDNRYVMMESEGKAIEDAFAIWISYRAPIIAPVMPEVILLMPILAYILRVSISEKEPVVKETVKK